MAALEGIAVRSAAMREDDDFAFDAGAHRRGDRRANARDRALLAVQSDGASVSADAAERLVRALERRGGDPIWLIHDEIYREQVFVDDAAELAQLYPQRSLRTR